MARSYWLHRARLLALRRNFGWWLHRFLPLLAILSAAAACALLLLRKNGPVPPVFWLVFAGVAAAAGVTAWLWARPSFICASEAFAVLDAEHRLFSRLAAAHAGVGEWPAPISAARISLRWNAARILPPVAFSVLLLLAASLVPISTAGHRLAVPTEEPRAWAEMETVVDQLEDADVVEKTELEKLKEQIDELRAQPAQKWFSHGSLEATESLRAQTESSLRTLQRELNRAAAALDLAPQLAKDEAALQALARALQQTLGQLETTGLSTNKELLKALQNVDLKNLRSLSPKQLQALQQRLKKGAGICASCIGGGEKRGYLTQLEELANQTGKGGVARGPGTAPLKLAREKTDLGSSEVAGVSNEDLSRALPADMLGEGEAEHEIDETASTGPVAAGAVGSVGEGGEAVWRIDVTPHEQQILRRYFK